MLELMIIISKTQSVLYNVNCFESSENYAQKTAQSLMTTLQRKSRLKKFPD